MKLNKSLIAIAIATLSVSNVALANNAKAEGIDGRIELRIPISELRSEGAAPSTYTPWVEVSSRTYQTDWSPNAAVKVTEYSKNKGRVLKDSGADRADADFAQERNYVVVEERYEQRRVYDGDGDAVPDGDPVRHERTVQKIEQALATVASGEWKDLESIQCTEWNSVGEQSRYLTPYNEQASGQERECKVRQTQDNVITDAESVDFPYSVERELYWIETSAQQGLLDNRSCKTLLDFYNANSYEIRKASSSWSYNGWHPLNNESRTTTYCSNGYTLVAAQYESNPVAWTGGGYSPGGDMQAKMNARQSFAFKSADIPSHSKMGVGQDLGIRHRVSVTYSTGNLNKSSNGYKVHRNTGSSYLWHNPNSSGSSASEWKNTLTVESSGSRYGSNYNWAFSPNALASCSRGYALNGYKPNAYDNFAWTVWVY